MVKHGDIEAWIVGQHAVPVSIIRAARHMKGVHDHGNVIVRDGDVLKVMTLDEFERAYEWSAE